MAVGLHKIGAWALVNIAQRGHLDLAVELVSALRDPKVSVTVRPFEGDWYTQAKRETDMYIERLDDRREWMGVRLSFGTVVVMTGK